MSYLRRFAEHFDLLRRIRFGSLVTRVESSGAGVGEDKDVAWTITVKRAADNGDGEEEVTEVFDNLAVCTGANAAFQLPNIKGKVGLFMTRPPRCYCTSAMVSL